MEDRARARVSTPFTWMAASKPQSTLAVVGRLSLEQMNKGETSQSNGEKQRARRKSSRLLTPQLRAAACVRSVLEDQAKLLIECENGSAYKCPDHSVSLVIKIGQNRTRKLRMSL